MFKFLLWQKYVITFVSLTLFGLVGSYDYDNAKDSEQLYCENVASGVWPPYKEIDGVYCPSEK